MSAWKERDFAQDYAENAINPEKNWYEHDVNYPNLLSMIPSNSQRVLDYGCGPGEFTAELSKQFPAVEGTDFSESMIEIAMRDYPNILFYTWENRPQGDEITPYDVIFSKLTVHFVENLEQLANDLSVLLKPAGLFVFSVPHPFSTIKKAGSYWPTAHYDTEIGSYDMTVTMIHRSVQDYLEPFMQNGYELVEINEPQTPQELSEKYNELAEKRTTPRRLNLSFKLRVR